SRRCWSGGNGGQVGGPLYARFVEARNAFGTRPQLASRWPLKAHLLEGRPRQSGSLSRSRAMNSSAEPHVTFMRKGKSDMFKRVTSVAQLQRTLGGAAAYFFHPSQNRSQARITAKSSLMTSFGASSSNSCRARSLSVDVNPFVKKRSYPNCAITC